MTSDAKQTILVVDDEKTNLVLLNRILAPDYTILTAKSGQEALDRAMTVSPDLILLDIIMPDMDGFEIIKRLKDNADTQNIPVIFITGLHNEADEEKGLSLGALDYIIKPFRNAIVRARVRNHMQLVRHLHLIERLGLVDPLTDIANRRSFDDHMSREWGGAMRECEPISLLMMDIDKFKVYNDTYGHPQGDALLKAFARHVEAGARRPRDIAARIGGEEFVLLCPETDHAGALEIAEQLRAAVAAMTVPTVDKKPTTTTVSIGVATCRPTENDTPQAFIELADKRLYAAKTGGRNRVVGEGLG
ncbi:MAG: diguanylate cyclase [Candidatus Accumulibacter sp.]|jgi:diguanylate cyclase (GGDEF)-like protein|nr:diguanylate cyclase [Accumulibacter sp.]